MGYTHYWYRKVKTFDAHTFRQFSEDCAKVCKQSEIPIAGSGGDGEPEFTDDIVAFNGRSDCGHKLRNLGITWPSPTAKGLSPKGEVTGQWFAEAMLEQRTCGGDCSHESFIIQRDSVKKPFDSETEIFDCTKTAYKPYDVLVTACLIIAAHYFGDQFRVSSDGESNDWEDGRRLCQSVLGYGQEFVLREDSAERLTKRELT